MSIGFFYLFWKYVSWSLMSQSSLKTDSLLRAIGSSHRDDQGRIPPSREEMRAHMWVRKTEWGLQETQIGCLGCAGHRRIGTETENKTGAAPEGRIVREEEKPQESRVVRRGKWLWDRWLALDLCSGTNWASYIILHWLKDAGFPPSAWNVLPLPFAPAGLVPSHPISLNVTQQTVLN